ncbi:uncharacterized protein LOC110848585 [Folsomia candida]|uniref:uncharacterized protein LOC110848585 n=1 Tax=Folsomia candida TaxID=158441 RepID=UPI001604FC27|nr:uncharacterized protein LOC110848585 [Folsomia candida]XP_035706903.1 uncharacterized protein LOC110848585 [Folsomia candida]XP_035706904.1 uncharacterized protein LOC110848585 [Folsomia candida]XP_035706905.1 uncharacterized protein LOC110848585 [Folsomia candida]
MRKPSSLTWRSSSSQKLTLFLVGIAVVTMLSVPIGVNGLQCYECLSLYCNSLAVCESVKRTMLSVFVPKGHIIHFNPLDPCPEGEDPANSTKWEEISRECQRSDSVCIVSPIEIISIIDGSKNGKKLESETSLTTTGYVRGCASRRKLQENDPTIRVHVNLLSSSGSKNKNRSASASTPSSSSSSSSSYGQPSQDLEMEEDLSKLSFNDGYQIKRVHSHEFFIDQGTANATKCFEDKCNTKVRARSGSSPRLRLSFGVSVLLLISGATLSSKLLFDL